MDAQCLLWDAVDDDCDNRSESSYICCGYCRQHGASKERQLSTRHPWEVTILFLRDICRNRVLRECARLFCICIAVGMLVIGVRKKELCPFEPAIPVFLLVDGTILVLHTGISALRICKEKKKCNNPESLDNLSTLLKILILFLVLWNLAGSVWIYSAEKIVQFHNSVRTNYCDVTAYYLAFGLVTSAYIVVGLVVLFILTTVISVYLYRKCTRKPECHIEAQRPESVVHM